ncbi:MAG: gamma-glutamylcyclotransferase, partial [Deltaproteobacteria bacterium]|nr:gamma-glutamylcyclotransferase [Deltaproteobacteria bacterium]
GAVTEGVLYLDVDAFSVKRLDDFEEELYERAGISADALDGESLMAQTYLIKPQYRDRLSSEPWDPEHFEKADLIDFMASYGGFNRTDPSDQSI